MINVLASKIYCQLLSQIKKYKTGQITKNDLVYELEIETALNHFDIIEIFVDIENEYKLLLEVDAFNNIEFSYESILVILNYYKNIIHFDKYKNMI